MSDVVISVNEPVTKVSVTDTTVVVDVVEEVVEVSVSTTGPQGGTGVVGASAPATYDSETNTVGVNQDGFIHISTLDYAQFDPTFANGSTAVGQLAWNIADRTLEFVMGGGNVTQQIGQEQLLLVKHADNSGLVNGKVVYVTGSDGSNTTVRYAQANAELTSANTIGVMTEDANGGGKAFATTFGMVHDLNTSALTEGATIWLSPTVAGGMTTTKPSAPDHAVKVAFCIRSHATQGVIFVSPSNGFELQELHDVAISTPTDNQVLTYEASTDLWKNKTIASKSLVRIAYAAPYDYIGTAPIGTLESSAGWKVTRLTIANNGSVVTGICANGIWNNRTSLVYV